ncbi:Protoporphyrinogen oxidase [Corynebacterium kutscheri]|uniref:Coproporphyrinogen III oxidase n=1 Tax=Corynebacterium kutscheri TaxID=35755 RepID=A0A0F6TCN5_9CORY|nr:protoporphyrinogen oxidase [Corynebacterium kutscheri]AKE40489.1 protoporphyrinogen oxidase [Corynebacterium kutscheri]VEH05101.1 Protoporphyrinogen oxidase [Corynebacterium kutscheri]VEH10884.1 Protoporphyrinogen oxidase [Corynebacterium kutscheri]VEH80639.1 Protoporphyrinogen oxidase [Corynebacterium kutscheri]
MRIAIIGAGLAGLTAAYELKKLDKNVEIEVFEAADRIGGKLYTVPFASGPTDMGAEAFVDPTGSVQEFLKELDLENELVEPSGLSSLIYANGKLFSLPKGTLMGIPATSEGFAEIVDQQTCDRIDNEANQDSIVWDEQDQSLGALIEQRYGAQVSDRVVSALQGGVYSAASSDLGIRATIPQLAQEFDRMKEQGEKITLSHAIKNILEMRAANQVAGYKPSLFKTFNDGYHLLYEALAEKSEAIIHVDAFISGVTKEKGKFHIKGAGDSLFDKVLFATPAPTTAMLVKTLVPEIVEPLKTIPLASSVVVGMKFDSDEGLPDNSGVLVALDEEFVHAKAFTFASKKWPHLAKRGGALVRASFGRYRDDIAMRVDEDTLVDYALDDLQRITGFDGRTAGLSEIYVQRWFGGLPVYNEKHLATVNAINDVVEQYDDLALCGAWAYGVGVPAVIAHARAIAKKLIS